MSTIRCRLTSRLQSLSWASFFLVLLLSPLTTNAANLTGLAITPPNPTLNINKTLQLIATGSYDDGTQQVIAQAKQVSAGNYHTCALSTDGTIKCWGLNDGGQLGNWTPTLFSLTPVTVSGISTAVAVSVGDTHTCALLADGTIKCWGGNNDAVLGYGTSPVTISGINTAVAVSAGSAHTCAVLADGKMQCWGYNIGGQLGNNTVFNSSAPVTVFGINTAVAVSAGADHTCALLIDGTAQCWGQNGAGQLGNGTYSWSPVPVTVTGINNAVTISAGLEHNCVSLADGTLRCWGKNNFGQLGNGTATNSSTPISVLGLNNAVAVSAGAGGFHTCAVLADGTARCWGSNSYGQLGDGTIISSSTPVTVSGLNNAVAVSAGGVHSCAVLADGTARCWGYNNYGQLGDGLGTTTSSSTPVAVSGISSAMAVSASGGHACAVLTDGTARCWGDNTYGQLGDGTTIINSPFSYSSTPVTVNGISNAVAISAGGDHACALIADGTIKCWGRNDDGQLGNGTTTNSSVPVAVSGISSAVAVSASGGHICALLAGGTVQCWGSNYRGQLGNGTTTFSSVPVTVKGIRTAVAIGAGVDHTCALLADGTLRCWGDNYFGELGDGTTHPLYSDYYSTTPVTVIGIGTAVAVSARGYGTCALLADGKVWCWGYKYYGQPNPDTTSNYSSTPFTVSGISNAVAISAGGDHACALSTDGTIKCWGKNDGGQLGNGTTISSLTPVTVSGLSTAVAVSNGTCAKLANSTLWCWGDNSRGQLGNGAYELYNPTPTATLGYLPVAWTSSNATVASVYATGKVKALASGTTLITASLNGLSASTLVTVPSALTLDGFWPGTATAGQFVFIFGQGFVPQQTKVQINGIPVSFVQVADPTLLFIMLPSGDTRGPITITTTSGSVTSALSFNVPLTGVQITGLWPSIVSPGQLVFVFGSGFVTNATTATVNSIKAPILQVLEPTLLFFMAPSTPTTGFVSITTAAGTATSASVLTIK